MIAYITYFFAVIGALITLKYVVVPFLYLSLCAVGYTRFRLQVHKDTWKKVGVKKALKHILWVWPFQGFQNGGCDYVTMGALKWYPPLKIEQFKQPEDE